METGSTAGKSTLAGTMASARHATMMAFATPMAASGMETGNRLRHQCRARHPRSCQGTVGCAGRQGREAAQELPVNPARGRHGTGQKGEGSARSVGVGVTIPRHLWWAPRSPGAC